MAKGTFDVVLKSFQKFDKKRQGWSEDKQAKFVPTAMFDALAQAALTKGQELHEQKEV